MSTTEPEHIIIRGAGAVSALGWAASAEPSTLYAPTGPAFKERDFSPPGLALPVAVVSEEIEAALTALRREPALRPLDRAALLGLLAARQAVAAAGWFSSDTELTATAIAIGIGSSRGATGRLEDAFTGFLAGERLAPTTSPLTTPGNLASAVAHDLAARGALVGAAVSHSSTCSSALQALGTGLAWLRAGLADRYLAGGTEAPLTPFTVAQLRAVGIYSSLGAADFPCRPGQASPAGSTNTFVLGEGAAVFALEYGVPQPGDLVLASVGFGFERAASRTGITPSGEHFQQAMRQALALAHLTPSDVDALILHAPGTAAGDAAEYAAIRAVFGDALPALLSNKWLLGHTLGAAGALSLDFARWLLLHPTAPAPAPPYAGFLASSVAPPRPRSCVLLNAAGFGGNAACAIVTRAQLRSKHL